MKKVLTIFAIALACMATSCKKEPSATDLSGGCRAIDMGTTTKDGKPLKWAEFNVGSTAINGRGDYYSWGETRKKVNFTWDEYDFGAYAPDATYGMTKYTGKAKEGDGLSVLLPDDDAATKVWGTKWRTPTIEEFRELLDEKNCQWTLKEDIGVYEVTSKITGNIIYLPFTGHAEGYERHDEATRGMYWSATGNYAAPYLAQIATFDATKHETGASARFVGCVVRAVTEY